MRLIKNIVLILSLIYSSSESFAQYTFIKYFPHGRNVAGFALNEHLNGDISFMSKFSEFSGSGPTGIDFGIHKINNQGNTIDSFYFYKQGDDYTDDFTIKNNSYYFTGSYFPDYQHQENSRELFYKVNSLGDTICKTIINPTGNSYGKKILERNNHFYLIGDEIDSNGTLNMTLKVLDSNGTVLNFNKYGGVRQDWAYDGIFTNDGGLVIAGHRHNSPSLATAQIYVVKIDSIGNEQWSTTIQKPLDSLFECDHRTKGIIQATNGDYYIVGKQEYCSFDLKPRSFLVCLDSVGNTKWFKTSPFFQGDNSYFQENLQAIVLSKDGNLVCLGGRFADNPGETDYQYDVFLTKFDLLGKKIWTHQYGKIDYYETPYDMIATSDGGFAISGRYAPYDITQMQIEGIKTLIIKTDACGCIVPNCDPNCIASGIEQTANQNQFKVFPNPATNKLSIESNFVIDSYIIYNLLGEKQLEGKYNSNIDISTLAKGMYLIQMKNETSFSTVKFIKE